MEEVSFLEGGAGGWRFRASVRWGGVKMPSFSRGGDSGADWG